MEDEEIIQMFFERSEQAVALVAEKYGKLCRKIAMSVLESPEDAEECVNDAYLHVWNSIPPNNPASLPAYVIRIVRNCAISRVRQNSAQKRGSSFELAYDELAETVAGADSLERNLEAKALMRIVEQFLDEQHQEDRVLFVRRYWFSDSYSDLAFLLGISEKNVSVRLTRMRKKLRKYLIKQGVLE